MAQYIHLAKSNMALAGNQKRRKALRESPVKANINLFSSGISRKLALKVAGFLLPMTLLTLFAIYQIAANEVDDTSRAAAINETESLLGSNAAAISNPSYAESPDMATLNKLNSLFAHGKIDAEELHFLLQESENPLQIPAWLELAANRIKTTPDNGIKDVLNVDLSAIPKAMPDTVSVNGKNYVAIGMLIAPMNWHYYRLIPQEKILAPVNKLFGILCAALFLISIVATIVFEITFRHLVVNRLQLLTDAAKRLATGDPNIRVGFSGDDEIAQAAMAFDRMAHNFEGHRNIESILNQLEHDYLDGKKAEVLLDDTCRNLATINAFPLVWVALQRDDRFLIRGAGGPGALEFRSYESFALSFCNEALKNRVQSYLHNGESPFPGAPTGQAAIFPLISGQDVVGAMVFHAPYKSGFIGEHWNAMRYWSGRLQHTLHVMENEREMLDVRLRMLQAQIEPHFLVNTLSNIITQVKSKPAVAKHMLSLLASYLRVSLTRTRGQRTTLKQELEVLSVYLEIQAFRMPGRLSHSISCAEELLELRFPPLLLQPLVENAVQHGIEPAIAGGKVTVEIYQSDEKLVLKVSDTGIGLVTRSRKNLPHSGVGISNIKNRLSGLYGQSANLKIMQNQPQGVLAIMEIPTTQLESI